jgi:exo-beta-1,3-glucanase (GH17 family)
VTRIAEWLRLHLEASRATPRAGRHGVPKADPRQTGHAPVRSRHRIEAAFVSPTVQSSTVMLAALAFTAGCGSSDEPAHASAVWQSADNLLAGEVMAVAYSGYREGQHPDRGDGAINPGRDQILEDLQILRQHGFRLIRLYDAGESSVATLELIRESRLPIKVLLGLWLRAEVSNHEGCPWLDEPIPDEELAANKVANAAEIARGVELARRYGELVIAVNVGNEALVDWNDHMVPVEQVIAYVEQVKAAIDQPVTVADNYVWWTEDGAELAQAVDFLGIHTYPAWEEKSIDEALAYTVENLEGVRAALPGKPIAILEAGWATTASEFGHRASEDNQARYYRELRDWATRHNVTVFFFEAFDEPWKGDPNDPTGAEKHWGLFKVDRSPKLVMRR